MELWGKIGAHQRGTADCNQVMWQNRNPSIQTLSVTRNTNKIVATSQYAIYTLLKYQTMVSLNVNFINRYLFTFSINIPYRLLSHLAYPDPKYLKTYSHIWKFMLPLPNSNFGHQTTDPLPNVSQIRNSRSESLMFAFPFIGIQRELLSMTSMTLLFYRQRWWNPRVHRYFVSHHNLMFFRQANHLS